MDFSLLLMEISVLGKLQDLVAKYLNMKITWKGKGINEKGINNEGKIIVACDRAYYRPLEVNSLLGDAKKARKILNWRPKSNLHDLISDMVKYEMEKISK